MSPMTLTITGAALIAFGVTWRGLRARQLVRERLEDTPSVEPNEVPESAAFEISFGKAARIVFPLAVGFSVLLLWVLATDARTIFGLAFAFLAFVLAYLFAETWRDRRDGLFESQLADAIDLMVSALHAGSGPLQSLTDAAKEARAPLKEPLERVVERIRLGGSPERALVELANRVRLEAFRLFALSLSTQWGTGGSLARPLATIGKFVRDRVETQRMVRSQANQTRVAVIAVLSIAYFILAASWSAEPERVEGFLDTTFGAWLASTAIVLQGAGILWISRLTRFEI